MSYEERINMIFNGNMDNETKLELLKAITDIQREKERKNEEEQAISYGEANRKRIEEINRKSYEAEQKRLLEEKKNAYEEEIQTKKEFLTTVSNKNGEKIYTLDNLADVSDKEIEKLYDLYSNDKENSLENNYSKLFDEIDKKDEKLKKDDKLFLEEQISNDEMGSILNMFYYGNTNNEFLKGIANRLGVNVKDLESIAKRKEQKLMSDKSFEVNKGINEESDKDVYEESNEEVKNDSSEIEYDKIDDFVPVNSEEVTDAEYEPIVDEEEAYDEENQNVDYSGLKCDLKPEKRKKAKAFMSNLVSSKIAKIVDSKVFAAGFAIAGTLAILSLNPALALGGAAVYAMNDFAKGKKL